MIYFPIYTLVFILFEATTPLSIVISPTHKVKPAFGEIKRFRRSNMSSETPKWVRPNRGVKNVLDLKKYPNARCLDGTPGAYYFSPSHSVNGGGHNKFYIFRMGGDVCRNYEDCLLRSQSDLGSTNSTYGWGPNLDLVGAVEHGAIVPHVGFRRDPDYNPLLWDWNHIFIAYCDGGYYAGSNSTPTYVDGKQIFFNGADIQSAILDDLAEKYNLSSASDVLVGGCSAGGVSTFATADWIFRHPAVPTNARVAAMSCSGFFLAEGNDEYMARFPFAYNAMNLSGALSAKCVESQENPSECIVPEFSMNFMTTPIFIWNSIFDQWALGNQYEMNCLTSKSCANKNKNLVTAAIASFWDNSSLSGGFLSGCTYHCDASLMGNIENIRPIDGAKPLQALDLWYNSYIVGKNMSAQREWIEDSAFPCTDCCPAHPK